MLYTVNFSVMKDIKEIIKNLLEQKKFVECVEYEILLTEQKFVYQIDFKHVDYKFGVYDNYSRFIVQHTDIDNALNLIAEYFTVPMPKYKTIVTLLGAAIDNSLYGIVSGFYAW